MTLMLVFMTAGMAVAGVGGSDVPTVVSPVIVGQTGVPFSFTITNQSTTPNDVNTVTVTDIYFTPACGSSLTPAIPCPALLQDPAVFAMSATGTGRAGTACPGTIFTIGAGTVAGEYEFTPLASVVLGDSDTGGDAAQCTVDFTVDVLSLPTNDSSGAAGMQTSQLARAETLTDDETAETGFAAGSSTVTVIAECGDGIVGNTPGETCDPPGSPAGGNGNDCRDDCTVCGDSVVDPGEECDDGNGVDGDGCSNDCTIETCGVMVDKIVDCGNGPVDVGLVSDNEDGTNGCSALDGSDIIVTYNVQNTGEVPLANCNLVDSNGEIVPGPVVGDVIAGATVGVPALDPPEICSDALEAGEPDTATVVCDCIEPGNPLGTVEASDEADIECLACEVDLTKEFSCDGGLTYGDGCSTSEFDDVLLQYTITNLSDPGVTLDNCTLSDDNPVIEGVNPGGTIGPITLPDIELWPPLVCDAELLLEEPDTGTVDCACTGPAGNTATVSATDDSDVDCLPDLEVGCRMTGGHNVMSGVEAEYDDIDTNTKYTTGGQIGAPNEGGCYRGDYPIKHAECVDNVCNGGRYYGEACSIDDDCPPATGRNAGIPYGDWEHNHHSGPDDGYITDGSFAFHSGTAAAPDEAFIQSIICADEGWCVQARPAPDKQIFWEGYGVFHNMKKSKEDPNPEFPIFTACGEDQPMVYDRKTGGSLHYYRAHVGDFGEPAGRHQKSADECPWANTMGVSISDCSLANNYDPLVPATENVQFTEAHPLCLAQDCVDCPDWYEIEIYCNDDITNAGTALNPIAYKVGHFIREGNFQIHPPVGDSCNPEDIVVEP
jgi:cysteine-rich repeat protein